MSLDDPNVIAGIATDGTPFFDDPNQAHNQARSATSGSTTASELGGNDVDTPMPMKRGSGQLQLPSSLEGGSQKFPISTAGGVENGSTTERDSREMKEIWKQYMRFPLSGSEMLTSMSGSEVVTPSGIGSKPGPGYRRQRVASLPAVKTPIVEMDRDHLDSVYLTTAHPSASTLNAGTGDASTAYLGRTSSREMPPVEMDTGMDNPEDLRSYEAAVMARKAPTTLNLKVRRPVKGRGKVGGTTLKKEGGGSSSPSQSSPASSSAEGDDGQSDLRGFGEVPSALMGGGNMNMGRPSFKRLPSQTLGPDNSKRPFYGFGGEVEDRVVSGWGLVGGDDDDDGRDVLSGRVGSAERRMRKRRMSEPSTGLTGFDRGELDDKKRMTSRADVPAVQNVDELWFY